MTLTPTAIRLLQGGIVTTENFKITPTASRLVTRVKEREAAVQHSHEQAMELTPALGLAENRTHPEPNGHRICLWRTGANRQKCPDQGGAV